MKNNEPIKALFDRYLANECTPEEVRILIGYFNVSEDNETLRDLIRQHLESVVPENVETERAVQEVYDKLLKKMIFQKEVNSVPLLRSVQFPLWPRVAAVWITLLISCGAAIYFFTHWSDHSFLKGKADNVSLQMRSEATNIGQTKRVALEDGSVIWLNAQSKLTYPVSFQKNIREVRLEGEAYFEVFRDTERPFIVRSGQIQTKVLGTSFNIKAYKDDPVVSVAVLTGKVQVNSAESAIQIIPDQQVLYTKTNGNIFKEDGIDASAQIAWKDGKMQFRNTLLSDVVKTLRRNYGVQIGYNTSLSNCPVHADFDSDTPVVKVLEMLSVSIGGKVTKRGNAHFYLDGTCMQPQTNLKNVGDVKTKPFNPDIT